jgi:hypothetical protein
MRIVFNHKAELPLNGDLAFLLGMEEIKMNYRKAFNRITLIAWSTIAVCFFMCSISLHNAQAQTLFNPAVNYGAGDGPSSVALGDLDGDGDLDLAVANGYSNNVSVLLGRGDGSFQRQVNYDAGTGPSSVALGDLDGDGDLDLAVANEGGKVSVLLGNGDGSFQSPVTYDACATDILDPIGSQYVAIGDLNGDTKPDLAVANDWSNGGQDGNVSVLLGKGDGSFQSPVDYEAGENCKCIAIDDLNGDGDLDLAVANVSSDNVSVLLGIGDGSFQSPVNYSTGRGAHSVAIGDLNGDDDLDLAVANEGGKVSVLLGNGDGSFQSPVDYEAGENCKCIAIDDLNEDGDLDLAVSNHWSANVSILINTGGRCVLDTKFEETSINVGERYYTDRSYTITGGVPSWMVGRTLIKTLNNERFNNTAGGYIRFTTPVSWWVYVLFDSRASTKPDWLSGWEHRSQYQIFTSLSSQPYLEVWRKYFTAGQCVDLGGNFGPESSGENRSNFVVVYGAP